MINNYKNGKLTGLLVVLCLLMISLTGCSNPSNSSLSSAKETPVTENVSPGIESTETPSEAAPEISSETATEKPSEAPSETSSEAPSETSAETVSDTSSGNNSLIRHHYTEHEYKHGEEGYFNLPEDAVEFKLFSQLSGTCWICASCTALMTAYQIDHDGKIELDQIELLNKVYDDDKEDGVFLAEGVDKEMFGGSGAFVVNELNREFVGDLLIDRAIDARDWTIDEVKEGIKKYGALYIGIPDVDAKKRNIDGYFTMNHPKAESQEYDHSISVLGFDDNFPKEYFREEASENGAWITFDSNYPLAYYYVSYDTPFDQEWDTPIFMSMTDAYSKVLSYDCGYWRNDPAKTGDITTTANVFKEKGTLAAIGTYALSDNMDLTVKVMTPDFKECLYSMDRHIDRAGYHVIKLDNPMEVEEYAIVVSYPGGAPVEGGSFKIDNELRVDTDSKKGQSFILMDGDWLDMSESSTRDKLGVVTNNACIKALYAK